jgi:DNA-binding NarL/FixJ family response regulator
MQNESTEHYDESERVIPKQMEEAYRLVAGEFDGLTVKEAAAKMGVSGPRVSQILSEFEKKAPQLFPLITKSEYQVLILLKAGLSNGQISSHLSRPVKTVESQVTSLIEKRRWTMLRSKTVSYSDKMDERVVRKF